jgi:hypothetical protein
MPVLFAFILCLCSMLQRADPPSQESYRLCIDQETEKAAKVQQRPVIIRNNNNNNNNNIKPIGLQEWNAMLYKILLPCNLYDVALMLIYFR